MVGRRRRVDCHSRLRLLGNDGKDWIPGFIEGTIEECGNDERGQAGRGIDWEMVGKFGVGFYDVFCALKGYIIGVSMLFS